MARPSNIRSVMVEIHRFRNTGSTLAPGKPYIRTIGFDDPAVDIPIGLGHEEFQINLNRLRNANNDQKKIDAALSLLSAEVLKLIPEVPQGDEETIQIDLVSAAEELCAFPFEACVVNGVPRFANANKRIVLTRRIRGEFKNHRVPWPIIPRVLFVHAAIDESDFSQDLVDEHIAALKHALGPWIPGGKSSDDFLVVKRIFTALDLKKLREKDRFTHIHILAHGEAIPNPELPEQKTWGLRLGIRHSTPVPPDDLADALAPADDLPVVITLACCDSGNQANSALPTKSLAQELHFRGVPVVLGSQLPLSKPGSSVLAKHFYESLLRGDDVRDALHDTRVKLHEERAEARHDWLSLVAYIRLPEGYADRLVETGLRMELAMLEAARLEAGTIMKDPQQHEELKRIEELVRARIASLRERLEEVPADAIALRQECLGLQASAHKRLAELLHVRNQHASAKDELQRAHERYRQAYESNSHGHWQGAQQLAVEAVLKGKFAYPEDWAIVLRTATLASENENEYWAYGTLAELLLLAPLAGRPADLDAARNALITLKERATKQEQPYAIESTRRQLSRYRDWWITDHGFFPNGKDLRDAAEQLLEVL